MRPSARDCASAFARWDRCASASTRVESCSSRGNAVTRVEGLEFFARAVLEAVVGTAAAIKPQVAFFERFGSEGYRVLERLIDDARDADVLVVADAKRGDFAVTNAGYAEAWLAERSPLRVDAVTASPYLGVDALAPLFSARPGERRGVFVLVATSNQEGRVLQQARTAEGERVEDVVLRSVADTQPARRRTRVLRRRSSARRATRRSSICRTWAVRSWCRAWAPRARARRTSRGCSRVVRRHGACECCDDPY